MEQLDDFMKKKFEEDDASERFVFREEYWQQAERLIEADEQRRKRRRALWWWWFGAGVFALALSVWCWWPRGDKPMAGTPRENAGETAGQDTTHTHTQKQAAAEPAPYLEATREKNNTNAPGKNTAESKNTTETNAYITDKQHNRKKTLQEKTAGMLLPATARLEPGGLPAAAASGTAAVPAKAGEPTATTAATTTTETAAGAAAEPSNAGANLSVIPFDPLPVEPGLLPAPFRSVAMKPRENTGLADDPARKQPDPAWHWGPAAGMSGYDSRRARERLGAWAGLSAQRPLGRQFALQADLLWRYQPIADTPPADTLDPNQSFQLKYDFGYTLDHYRLEPRALHLLELPLALQWRRGPWRAEAGVAPGYLLAVTGRQSLYREDSFTESKKITSKPVRLNTDDYRRFYAAAFAGAQWEIKPGMQLGLRLHYRPSDLRRPLPDTPATPPRQRLWLDAGFRWYLFK